METFTSIAPEPKSGRSSGWSRDDDIGNVVALQGRTGQSEKEKKDRQIERESEEERWEIEERVAGREEWLAKERRGNDVDRCSFVQK